MAKEVIQVNLQFNADVSKAKAAMNDLQKSLDNIMGLKANDSFETFGVMTEDLDKASVAAAALRIHLQDAFNVKTGKLDFVKLNQSLKQSGMTAESLRATFQSIGPAGQQAFLQLSQAIATSEIPIIRISDRMRALGDTMLKTVRWQISSTVLHGFIRSISSAYNYAKDLNESLNNIRIVTGQTVEQMDAFAEKANKAAKALSTSTLAYTDAALIFYQQGLGDQEVEARTNVTMKLSNVTGESAEEVSSQMTAIWNNFADGSENLEYFADVITKLGAITASSSAEIAQGLGKFAAVADTVGLSYEKASAALATVVAATRQSADTVGTAFKTIFARMEGLKLGETLEDGVELNQYAAAMAKIGVHVVDANGNLKEMDTILDEMGAKWQTLSEAQKVATAETVAGVRQYAQFMALMNNYDKIMANQNIAETSGGTLEKQQEIYAESWEAASKRAKAALQGLYTTLLDDDAFISLSNGFAKIIEFIQTFTDSLGGLKGVLTIVSSLLLSTFSTQIAGKISMMGNSLMAMTSAGRAKLENRRNEFTDQAVEGFRDGTIRGELSASAAKSAVDNAHIQEEFGRDMSPAQQKVLELLRQRADVTAQEALEQAKITQELQHQAELARGMAKRNTEETQGEERARVYRELTEAQVADMYGENGRGYKVVGEEAKKDFLDNAEIRANFRAVSNEVIDVENINKSIESIQNLKSLFEDTAQAQQKFGETGQQVFNNLIQKSEAYKKAEEKSKQAIEKANKDLYRIDEKTGKAKLKRADSNDIKNASEADKKAAQEAVDAINEQVRAEDELRTSMVQVSEAAKDMGNAEEAAFNAAVASGRGNSDALRSVQETAREAANGLVQTARSAHEAQTETENLRKAAEQLKNATMGMGQSLVTIGQAASQLAMAINAIKSIGNIWSNEDISTGEKLLQTMMSLSMILPVLTMLTDQQRLSSLKKAAVNLYESAAIAGGIVLEKIGIAVKWKDVAANEALAISGQAALVPALTFIAIAAAVIAALYGIYKIIDLLINAESEEEAAARKANEELERSKEIAEDLKNKYQELKNAVSDYDDIVETLSKCTKGTQEWRDAFQEVIDKTYDLLDTYPQLLKYENLFKSDGTLNQDTLQQAVEDANLLAAGAQRAVIRNQTRVSTTQLALSQSRLQGNIRSNVMDQYYANALSEKSELGLAVLGLPFLAALNKAGKTQSAARESEEVAKVTNAVKEHLTNLDKTQYATEEQINTIIKEQAQKAGLSGKELDNIVKDVGEVIIPLKDNFAELSDQASQTTQSLINANKLLVESFFGEEIAKNPEKELDYQLAYLQKENDLQNAYDLSTKQGRGGVGKIGMAGTYDNLNNLLNSTYDTERLAGEMYDQYFEIMGMANDHYSKALDDVFVKENDQLYFKYIDETGEQVLRTITEVSDAIVQNKLLAYKDEMIEMAESGNLTSNYSDAQKQFLLHGNFGNVKYYQIDKVNSNWLNSYDEKALKELYHAAYGTAIEDIQAPMLESWKREYQKTLNAAKNVLSDIPSFIQESMGKHLINNLTIDSLKDVSNLYERVLANSGQQGVESLNEILASTGAEADEIITAFSQMDIVSMSIEEVQVALQNLGITSQLTGHQILLLQKLFANSSQITIEQAQETYNQISKIISKLKAEGDTIEKEQYEQLIALNPVFESYFTMMADGTYMLTGAAEEFKNAVQLTQQATLEQGIKTSQDLATLYDGIKDNLKDYNTQTITQGWQGVKVQDGYDRRGYYRTSGHTDWIEDYIGADAEKAKAQLAILADLQPNDENITKWQAMAEAGELTAKAMYDIGEEFIAQGITEEQVQAKIDENIKKAQELQEALNFQNYQNEISNTGLNFEETEDYAKYLAETEKNLHGNIEAARALAIANQRLDRGLGNLNDDFEDLAKNLKEDNKGTLEYSKALSTLKDDFADILNISSGDKLSTNFIEKVAKDSKRMTKILAGDADAIQEFRDEAFADITENLDLGDKFDTIKDKISALAQEHPELDWLDQLNNGLTGAELSVDGLKEAISHIGEGAGLSQEYTNALNAMLAAGEITADDLNDIFSTIGYKPEVTTGYVNQTVETPEYTTVHKIVAKGTEEIPYGNYNGSFRDTMSVPTWTEESYTISSGHHPEVQSIPVAQIATNQNGKGKINITNAGSTSIKPSIGATSAGKKGGGGGGGSSRSPKEPKKASDEIQRYHKIDKTIDSLSKQYSHLKNARDGAYGADKLAIIEKETALLQEQTEAVRERAKEAENYLAQDKANIEAYGAMIDKNGVISNYDKIMQAQLDKLNAVYEAYNAGGSSDEAVEAAEKEYEEFKKILEQYEETFATFLDAQEEINAKVREQLELALEKVDITLQLKLDISEEEMKKIEFKLQRLEGLNFRAADRIVTLSGKIEISKENFKAYQDAFRELLTTGIKDEKGNIVGGFGFDENTVNALMNGQIDVLESLGLSGENKQLILDKLKEMRDSMVEEYSSMREALDSIWEEYTSEANKYIEEIESQINHIQKLASIASNIKDLIGTVGKDTLGVAFDIMKAINQTIIKTSRDNIRALRAEYDAQQTTLEEYQRGLAAAQADYLANPTNETAYAVQRWTEAIKEAEEKTFDLKDSLISAASEAAEKMKQIMVEEMQEAFDQISKDMYSMTLSDAQESYDRYKNLSDATLQDYQKIYELSKLTRSINKSINDTDNVRAKQMLRDLEKEIVGYQADGAKMTQYQVDYLNKVYELRLAQIALEEAQNAKDQIRLARNADGGWGYVYTANASEVDKAQQDYEDKLYALQELNRQAIEDSQSTILQLQQQFQDAIAALSDKGLSEEEFNRQTDDLQNHYQNLMNISSNTLGLALGNNNKLYNGYWDDYSQKYNYAKSLDKDYVDSFEETWAGINTGLSSAEDWFNSYWQRIGSPTTEGSVLYNCSTGFTNYIQTMQQALEDAGLTENGDFNAGTISQMNEISSATDSATVSAENLADEWSTMAPGMTDTVTTLQETITTQMELMATAIENVTNAVKTLQTVLNNIDGSNINNLNASLSGSAAAAKKGINSSINDDSSGNDESDLYTKLTTVSFSTPWGNFSYSTYSPSAMEQEIEKFYNNYIAPHKRDLSPAGSLSNYALMVSSLDNFKQWVRNKTNISLDSGGYTGDFGPEGRLAMLHQKELVLNQEDTRNMLEMVALARESLGSVTLGNRLSGYKAVFGKYSNLLNNNLQQSIAIEAHFPNAINHNEIEQAIINLANYTAQNAYNLDISERVNIF